jgi:hypothetical protein
MGAGELRVQIWWAAAGKMLENIGRNWWMLGCTEWTDLAQQSDKWQALYNFGFHKILGNS